MNRIFLFLIGFFLLLPIPSFAQTDIFKVEWYKIHSSPINKIYNISVQNLDIQKHDFNFSIFFDQTNFNVEEINNIYLSEWKNLSNEVQYWKSNITCEFKNINGTNEEICTDNGYYEFITVYNCAWKPSKIAMFKKEEKLESDYTLINIPKYESKEKDCTINGTKWFQVEFQTPLIKEKGYGSRGKIAIFEEISNREYHPYWNDTWLFYRNFSATEPNIISRTNWYADLYVNSSNWTHQPYNDTIRIINSTGSELSSQVWNITQTNGLMESFTVTFLKNYTQNQNETLSMYYHNSSIEETNYASDLACDGTWLNSTDLNTEWDSNIFNQYWNEIALQYSGSGICFNIVRNAGNSNIDTLTSSLLDSGSVFCRMSIRYYENIRGIINSTIRIFARNNFYEEKFIWISGSDMALFVKGENEESGVFGNVTGEYALAKSTTYYNWNTEQATAYSNGFGYAGTNDAIKDVIRGQVYKITDKDNGNMIRGGNWTITPTDGTGSGIWLNNTSMPYNTYRFFNYSTTFETNSLKDFTKKVANPITIGSLGEEQQYTPPPTPLNPIIEPIVVCFKIKPICVKLSDFSIYKFNENNIIKWYLW